MDAVHPVGPNAGIWAQIWPSGGLRGPLGPPKSFLGSKRVLLGAPGVP